MIMTGLVVAVAAQEVEEVEEDVVEVAVVIMVVVVGMMVGVATGGDPLLSNNAARVTKTRTMRYINEY